MTQLQVEYKKAVEAARSNRAREELSKGELDTKIKSIDIAQREQELRELKVPYEITRLISQSNLDEAQKDKALAQIQETFEHAKLMIEQQSLVGAQSTGQRIENQNKIVDMLWKNINRMWSIIHGGGESSLADQGAFGMGDIREWVGSIFKGFGGGLGKAAGAALIG